MKKIALIYFIFVTFSLQGQCTYTASISASGPTEFCEEGSVDLTVHAASNTWTQKADFGGIPRKRAAAFSIGSKLYIGTGDGGSGAVADFWEYDVTTDVWTRKADFAGTARFDAVGFSIGDKGYIGTGQDISGARDDFWEYDPAADSWVQKADFQGGSRILAIGFSIGNKGYMGTSALTNDFWEYNPATDTWTQKANVGTYQRYGSVAFSIGNRGYVGGGYMNAGFGWGVTDDFWEYNPASNTWTQKANISSGIYTSYIKGFSIGNKGYIGTGLPPSGPGIPQTTFSEYNPTTNTWVSRAATGGGGRWGTVGLSCGSKGYFCTGQNVNSTLKKDFWEYAPAISTYSWSTGSSSSSISASVTGSYVATVTNVAGNIATATQTIGVCVALKELQGAKNNPVKIYPNPNSGDFSLNFPKTGVYTILNALGQAIRIVNVVNENEIVEINYLPEGLYYVNSLFSKTKIVVMK